MDHKPQRPRTVRVPRDENAPIHNPVNNKTLHHRNKSTPALSTVGGAAGVPKNNNNNNIQGKRTAFGDVSNTAVARPAKEDGLANAKVTIKTQDNNAKVTAAVPSRPAQRQTGNAKPSLATSASLGNLNPATAKPVAAGNNTGKTGIRRNTVFRDAPLQAVPEAEQTVKRQASVDQGQQQHQQANTVKTRTSTVSVAAPTRPVSTNGGYGELLASSKEDHPREAKKIEQPSEVLENQAKDVSKNTDPARGVITGTLGDMPSTDVIYEYPPEPSDPPEEYWDAECDGGHYEDGYVTTESQRSRGENTTEAATLVLFPQYSNDVKVELAQAKKLVETTRTIEDYEDECWDTSMVAEYGDEIFQYMRDLERRLLPNPHYMDNQAEIQWSMRSVLMDWLVQVHVRFSLLPETLFLCVNYIDRFLSCKIVSLGKLQLVGATAIFIAAKYEEINCPSVQEIEYMVDHGYSADEILKAERFMLNMLQFELGWPGPMSFLRRISKADDYDLETRTLSKYLVEVTIMDERFVGRPPSFIAAGAHCLSRLLLRKGGWTPEHVYYSNYTYSQLYPLVSLILECCDVPQKHHAAIYEKYTDKRFKRASYFVESEIAKGFAIPDASAASRMSMVDMTAQRY